MFFVVVFMVVERGFGFFFGYLMLLFVFSELEGMLKKGVVVYSGLCNFYVFVIKKEEYIVSMGFVDYYEMDESGNLKLKNG